jgi:hypothetical protein
MLAANTPALTPERGAASGSKDHAKRRAALVGLAQARAEVLMENGAKAQLAARGQQGIVYMAEITRRARTARITLEASGGRPSLPRTCNVRTLAKAAGAVHVHDDVHAARDR